MSLERAVERVFRILIAPALLMLAWSGQTAGAAEPGPSTASLVVHADREGPKVSPMLYGIFFEDINCSADGGIYAEMVRNRSFEDSDKPEHWSVGRAAARPSVELAIDAAQPVSPKNPQLAQGDDRRTRQRASRRRQRRLLGHGREEGRRRTNCRSSPGAARASTGR